ncbi:MAG TPA: hypothetical protein VGL99_14625, partial [Chloroflexota bacterium]
MVLVIMAAAGGFAALRATTLLQVQALKNTLLRGADAANFDKYAKEFDARANEMRGLRKQMGDLAHTFTPEEQALLAKFDAGWAGYIEAWPKAKEAYGGPGGGKQKEADADMNGKDRDAVAALDELSLSVKSRLDTADQTLASAGAGTFSVVLGLLGLGVTLGLAVAARFALEHADATEL